MVSAYKNLEAASPMNRTARGRFPLPLFSAEPKGVRPTTEVNDHLVLRALQRTTSVGRNVDTQRCDRTNRSHFAIARLSIAIFDKN